MVLCVVFTPIEPSVSGHDYALLLGYAESPMKGGMERLRAPAEVNHGPPPGDLPASATAHQTLLFSPLPSFQKDQGSPTSLFCLCCPVGEPACLNLASARFKQANLASCKRGWISHQPLLHLLPSGGTCLLKSYLLTIHRYGSPRLQ